MTTCSAHRPDDPVSDSLIDRRWMKRALAFAARGGTAVHPNPRVGAVIVFDGKMIAHGWHHRAGGAHAELEALAMLGPEWTPERLHQATLYVTLEPCNHHGRTPPCADVLLRSGIRRIVVAMRDPNPQVVGGGVDKLRAAGIEVRCGCLEQEARVLNRQWVHAMERGGVRVTGFLARRVDGSFVSPGESSGVPAKIVERVRRFFPVHDFVGPITRERLDALGEARYGGVLLESPNLVFEALRANLLSALVVVFVPEFHRDVDAASLEASFSKLPPARFIVSGHQCVRGIASVVYSVIEP